jgi:hypothetical protein
METKYLVTEDGSLLHVLTVDGQGTPLSLLTIMLSELDYV